MSENERNPYLRFGLDPTASLAEITERMRELAEDATSDEERASLRRAWEALSRSPARRFELALEAGPSPVPISLPTVSVGAPPPWPEPTLADVLARPPLAPMLPAETRGERSRRSFDLSAFVRSDEAEVTGEIPRRRA
jgi:hypothetical protein